MPSRLPPCERVTKVGALPSRQFSCPSPVLRPPRTPSRHHAVSDSPYRRGLAPTRVDIRYVADYPPGQCCGPQLVFICRPFRCAKLADLRARYEQVAKETIRWTLDPGPFSTLNLYIFRQRS